MSAFSTLSLLYRPAIEDELRQAINLTQKPGLEELHHMLAYHMGWEGDGAGLEAQGKRIRPQLVLLCTQASGSEWQNALPAAAAVELIHNFSLIHDDIEDNSPLRHNRPTLWTKWGIPQAINTGDALFTISHLASLGLKTTTNAQTALEAVQILQATCLHLTEGQFLDISYAENHELTPEDYWPMVSGKTAALLSCCTELGALIANSPHQHHYKDFGRLLGLAFQVQDDILGIWGDSTATGKSTSSDLVEGKKSLPVLIGLSYRGDFARRWGAGQITPNEVPAIASQLEAEGARAAAQTEADKLTSQALEALHAANPQGDAGQALFELADKLLKRDK